MKIPGGLKFLRQLQLKMRLVGVMLMLVFASSVEAQGPADPRQVVSKLQEALIKAMREGAKLGYQGRYELLAPVVDQTHDLDFIARTTLGANWAQLSPE